MTFFITLTIFLQLTLVSNNHATHLLPLGAYQLNVALGSTSYFSSIQLQKNYYTTKTP